MTNIIKICTGIFVFIIAVLGIVFCFSLIHHATIKDSQKPLVQISSFVLIFSLLLLV